MCQIENPDMSMKAKYLYWDFLFGERGGLVRVTIGYCNRDTEEQGGGLGENCYGKGVWRSY